jgi:hypothetical protein
MTAVEWLKNKILVEMELYTDEQGNWIDNTRIAYVNAYKDSIDLKAFVEQANELFEQQIKDAYNQGYRDGDGDLSGKDISLYNDADLYYNETYKK